MDVDNLTEFDYIIPINYKILWINLLQDLTFCFAARNSSVLLVQLILLNIEIFLQLGDGDSGFSPSLPLNSGIQACTSPA